MMDYDIFSRNACFDMVEDADNIYYYANEKNILCKYDKRSNKNHILKELNEDSFFAYASIQKVDEKLVLAPYGADDILIYDLNENEGYKIPVEIPMGIRSINYNEDYKFWDSFVFKEFVYMIGFFYPAIIKLNTITMEIEYLTECCDYINKKRIEGIGVYFVHGEVIEDTAWISCACCNMMIKLDLQNMIFEYHTVPLIDAGCGAFLYDNRGFWIGEWGANFEKIVYWNPVEGVEKQFTLLGKRTDGWCPIHSIIDERNKIHIVSFGDVDVYELDKNSGLIEKSEINQFCNCKIYNEQGCRILAIKKSESSIRFITGDYVWHEYDFKKKKHAYYKINTEDIRILINIIEKKQKKLGVQRESYGALPVFFKYVLNVDRKS